jgi:DNA polymerase III delta prime subunit
MVWHAHFLSLACQQSLRRWLETKSFRTRVWFHAEYINNIQMAIQSRCILKTIRAAPLDLVPHIEGDIRKDVAVWTAIKTDKDLLTLHKQA